MIIKLRLFFKVIIAVCLAQSIAHADATKDLQHFFSDIKSYSASFEQVVLDENQGILDQSVGSFWIERPGRFRWEYKTPSEQVIVGTGDEIWIYDVELEQVTHRKSVDAITQTPAALLAGEGDLDASFQLEDLGRRDELDWVRMLPNNKDSGFLDIRVGFKNGQLRLLELLDTFDQTTRMRFTGIQENISIPTETFSFTPPAGIDVVED
ncbi:MAG TPA: outer membrane lipoprotein carrier protein LolA [Gammaproteobacteria bacterium]|nr:outer membrane lipoprotein carrier protein LolA [Gammaproteobacteria bacterium]